MVGKGLANSWRAALTVLGIVGWLLSAAATAPGVERIRFRNYSVEQGLPQASIVAMAQDRTGYLWFGTQDGLARFDGYEFRVYRHDRERDASLANNYVRALVPDPDGSLWVGTQTGGLDHYLPQADRFEHFHAGDGAGSLAGNTVSALAIGADGRLWVATSGRGLQWKVHDSKQFHAVATPDPEALAVINALLPLPDGDVLVAAGSGLWRVAGDGGAVTRWGGASAAVADMFALARGAQGEVWAGAASAGLYHFDAAGHLLRHYQHDADPGSLPDDEIRGLYIDAGGALWIAGNSRGLARLDPASGKFSHFLHQATNPRSIAANRLWCVMGDRDGLLLVGSWTNGFSVHDPDTELFTEITAVPGNPRALPAPPARSVYADPDGTLWVGMIEGGGLVHVDLSRGVLERYRHDDKDPGSLSSDAVQFVTRGPHGALWVATSAGLDRLRDDGSFEHFRHDPDDPGSLAGDSLRYVYFDREGTLWVATKDAGLDSRCAGCTRFQHHGPGSDGEFSIDALDISNVLETRDGALWVGTRAAGLYRRGSGDKHFQHIVAGAASGLSTNLISVLYQDSRGALWVGTQGGALNRARDPAQPHFEVIDNHDGLASDAIGGILEAADGSIWVSTVAGISRIDPTTGKIRNFGVHDGTSERGYWVNSVTRMADGRLVFGGINGITLVDAGALRPPRPTRPVITALILHGRRYAIGAALPPQAAWDHGQLTLGHQYTDLGVEFSSLEYSAPESTHYAYRLDGHDHTWIDALGNRRVARYTNLPAGHYKLRVRARHDAGPWSSAPASLSFTVRPAPWNSPLAWLMYALGAAIVGAVVVLRIRTNLAHRRAAQWAVERSEERLKMALWGSGSELWDIEFPGGRMYRENRVVDVAAAAGNGPMTLNDYAPFVHPDDRAGLEAAMVAALKGESTNFEASYRLASREGGWVWLLSRGRVIERDGGGRVQRVSGTSSDITALKQAELSLRELNEALESRVEARTAELRDANRELHRTLDHLTEAREQLIESEKLASLGSLVAGVAHEINTPLGVGVTAASYLADEVKRLATKANAGELDDATLRQVATRVGEGAQLILRNLRRADQLVKSFKRVAVDQAGGDVRQIDLATALDDIATTLGPVLRQGRVEVTVDCAVGTTVVTSPGALHQIISNLVMNSITHGFAERDAGHIRIAVHRDGDAVVLGYHDDGAGMVEAVRARAFEPFFTTRRGRGGSGLGMHIVYTLATQVMKGTIRLESAPGAGVTVTLRFADLVLPS